MVDCDAKKDDNINNIMIMIRIIKDEGDDGVSVVLYYN